RLDRVEAERKRYKRIYDQLPVGVVVLNRSGWIEEANHEASRLIGIERNGLEGRSLSLHVAVHDRAIFSKHLRDTLEELGSPQQCQIAVEASPGVVRFTAYLESVAISDDVGRRVCLMAMSDATTRERERDATVRRQANERAGQEAADRARARFDRVG